MLLGLRQKPGYAYINKIEGGGGKTNKKK